MSIFCVVATPFGTEVIPLPGRALFWPATIGSAILVGAMLRVLVRDFLGLKDFWPEAPLIAVLAGLVLTPLISFLLSGQLGERHDFHPGFWMLACYVVLVSLVTSALRHAVVVTPKPLPAAAPRRDPQPPAEMPAEMPVEMPAAAPEPTSRLLTRLAPELRAQLIRLQVRDHYVDVVTDAGTGSVLLRLVDAIAETEGIEGLQVHRSHWVARRGIRAQARSRGRMALLMLDGAEVPVSRANMAVVLGLGLPEMPMPDGGLLDEAEAAQ